MNINKKPHFDEKQWKQHLKEAGQTAQESSHESARMIEEMAHSVDAVALFTAVFADLVLVPAESASEMTHGEIPAKLELLAYHLFPLFGASNITEVSPWHVNDCIEALNTLFDARGQQRISRLATTDVLGELIQSLQMEAEIVRGSAYPEQTTEEIESIQGRFEPWFATRLGIGPCKAQGLLWAIIRAQERTANAFIEYVNDYAKGIEELWRKAKKKKQRKTATDEDDLILRIFPNHEAAWIFGKMQCLNKIAQSSLPVCRTDVDDQNVQPTECEWDALRNLIGLTKENRQSMTAPIEVRQQPMFVLPDNHVLLADISNGLDALWERFEQTARSDGRFYDRYQRAKARWLEDKISQCLSRIFPATHIYQKLSYPDPDKSDGSMTELDMAVHWGPFLVLIEAKAKQFRMESQLGDVGRLRTDIKANVEDAFEQARRAARYIESVDTPVLKEIKTGRRLTFHRTDILRIYLLTVSQHRLASMATNLAMTAPLRLFQDGEYPFSICVADLEITAQFCPGPDVFLHYIERRLAIQQETVYMISDELNLFGAYLATRLQADRLWEQEGKRPDFATLIGWHIKFDEWMEYQRGERTTAPEIKLEVPAEIEEMLIELRSRENDDGARWIAFALLGMSDASLAAIAQALQEVRIATITPGMFRRMAHQDGDTVISLVASFDIPPNQLRKRTEMSAMVEKYRRKATKSIGIGIMVTDKSKPFDCATWVEGPWEHDPEMEKVLELEPGFIPAPGTKVPGRNQPCICGSGKKFKRCCLPKIETARREVVQHE